MKDSDSSSEVDENIAADDCAEKLPSNDNVSQ
jgi:hypothetical protein